MMNITKLNLSHLSLIVCFSVMNSVDAAPDAKQPESSKPSKWGLAVSEYAPDGSDPISFNWATHIAFGPKGQEIVTDLNNNRFLYRDGPGDLLKVSPIAVRGHHSVVYNPVDNLYYANDTANHRLISRAQPLPPRPIRSWVFH